MRHFIRSGPSLVATFIAVAIAAVVITFVNILGGLYIGMVENSWTLFDCMKLYTKLTIGDGLVSQVPAFIVSVKKWTMIRPANTWIAKFSTRFARPKRMPITK